MRFYKGSLCRDARASPKSQINNGGRPVDLVRLHHTLHHSFWCFGIVGQNNSLKTSDIISDKLNKTENASYTGEIQLRVHDDMHWVSVPDLPAHPQLSADLIVSETLVQNLD